MKKIRLNHIIQLVVPLMLYLFIYEGADSVFLLLLKDQSRLFSLLLAAVVTIPFVYVLYRRLPIAKRPLGGSRKEMITDMGLVFLVVLLGVFLNLLIGHLPILRQSVGYTEAMKTLSSGSLCIKIAANGIFIPILEELVYRGNLCGQLETLYGKKIAIVVSSLLFGLMHYNLVQFFYAFIMGIFLSLLYVKTKKMLLPVLSHGILNLLVIFL